jgi:outer membrane protein
VINNKEQLREITNVYYDDIAKLKRQMPLLTPEPANIETWVAKSEQFNFNLQAALFSAQAARDQIKINFSGHLPTVDLNGSYIDNHGQPGGVSGAAVTSAINTRSTVVGLQLNMPIYQGGLVNSQVRQAQFEYQNAIALLENTHRQVSVQLRQTYNSIVDGISKIKADKQAIISQQSSVDSTDAAVKVGTRTIVDLLLAQQQLYQGQKTLAQDQYTYIINTLTLKQLTGTLTVRDIETINTWLRGQANKSAPQNIYRKKVDESELVVNPQIPHHHHF